MSILRWLERFRRSWATASVRTAVALIAAVVLLAGYVALSISSGHNAPLRDGELVLPAQARLAITGHLPGRGFTPSQMPLSLMLAGLFMAGLGYSIDIARILAAILAGVGIGLSAWVVARRTGRPGPGLAAGFLLVASVYWVTLCLSSLPIAAAIASLGLALFWALGRLAPLKRIALSATAVGLAASFIPAAMLCLPMALAPLSELKSWRRRLTGVIVTLGIPALVLGLQAAVFLPQTLWLAGVELPRATAEHLSVFELLVAIWRWAPAPLLVFVIGICGIARLLSQRAFPMLALLAAGLAPLLLELSLGLDSGQGAAFALPLLTTAGILMVQETGDLKDNPLCFAALLFPLIAFIYPVPPVIDAPEQLQAVRDLTTELKHANLPNKPILSSIPAIAAAIDHDVVPGTQLGPMSIADPRFHGSLVRRQTQLEQLATDISDAKAAAIILKREDSKANFGLLFPSGHRLSSRQRALLSNAVNHAYERAGTFGDLELYLPIHR